MTAKTIATRPLQSALHAAYEALASAETAYRECECEMPDSQRCAHYRAMSDAGAAVDAATRELRASDELREWVVREAGYDYGTIEAACASDALDEASDNVDSSLYDSAGTQWITVRVRCELTSEEDSTSVQLDPDEPECESSAAHDWQSPHQIVGGLKDNPGVWGHGGGVVIHEVCMRCGCGRVTDTWAQNPETGEQGLSSVTYEPGKYADEI